MPENHTTKDVINLLMEIKVEQAAAGAKQEAMHGDVTGINTRLDKQNGRIGRVETRTDATEAWQDKVSGGGVLAGKIIIVVGVLSGVAKLLIG